MKKIKSLCDNCAYNCGVIVDTTSTTERHDRPWCNAGEGKLIDKAVKKCKNYKEDK